MAEATVTTPTTPSSTTKKATAPAPAPAPRAPAGEPIAIQALYFNRPNGISIPGSGEQVQSIDASPKNGRDGYEIELLPWLRQYRVKTVPSGTKKSRTILIPESWAIAELVEVAE